MKRLLRRLLSAEMIAALATARRRVDASVGAAVGKALAALPLRVKAITKSRLESVGRLDYGSGSIRLVVDSEAELPRLNSCLKEPETVAWIEQVIRPGDVVFDIGANVGAYSLVVDCATGGRCKVFAFEPSYSNFAQLSRNVALNGSQGRIVPVLIALSDVTALATFNYSSVAPGAALHALGHPIDQSGRPFTPALSQPVLTFRMDDFIDQFVVPTPNHIKLDVDGIELRVLLGASRTLADPALRSVLVEVEPARPESRQIQSLLLGHGFSLTGQYPHGSSEDSTSNLVYVREIRQE